MKTFDAQKLKDVRIKRGISQQAAAKRLGISPQKLSNYENGHALPPANILIAMLEFYAVSHSDIASVR